MLTKIENTKHTRENIFLHEFAKIDSNTISDQIKSGKKNFIDSIDETTNRN